MGEREGGNLYDLVSKSLWLLTLIALYVQLKKNGTSERQRKR